MVIFIQNNNFFFKSSHGKRRGSKATARLPAMAAVAKQNCWLQRLGLCRSSATYLHVILPSNVLIPRLLILKSTDPYYVTMPSWYALKRHVRKSALVQVREHLGGWLRFFFGTLGLFDFLNKTKLELYYTCMSRRYFVHQYIIFRDFLNYEILVRKSYSEYKFWDEWHGFYLAGLSLLISSYLRQQIEYHAILWWTNQRK